LPTDWIYPKQHFPRFAAGVDLNAATLGLRSCAVESFLIRVKRELLGPYWVLSDNMLSENEGVGCQVKEMLDIETLTPDIYTLRH